MQIKYNIYYNSNYILIVPITYSTYIAISVSVALQLNTAATPTYYIDAQANLEIIGSTTIRDDIYLFTTSNTSKNPGGHSFDDTLAVDANSVGQIWKLEYSKIDPLDSPTLTLIYNNYVDFSTYNAIAPTACLGRYENSATQRLYWTDNL